jgi:hypothetical protein
VLIIRGSKLYYTASGIVTLCRWPSRAQVERGLKTRFCALSWLITKKKMTDNFCSRASLCSLHIHKLCSGHVDHNSCVKQPYCLTNDSKTRREKRAFRVDSLLPCSILRSTFFTKLHATGSNGHHSASHSH